MLRYKTNREIREFKDERLDNRVKVILLALNGEMELRYGVSLRVSCVNRTREEQIAIYGKFKDSPHFSWRAVDISLRAVVNATTLIRELKSEELEFIDRWVDETFIYDMEGEQRYQTSVLHEVINEKTGDSAGVHIHLQVTPRGIFTRIKKR